MHVVIDGRTIVRSRTGVGFYAERLADALLQLVFFGMDDLDRRVRYVGSELRSKLLLEKRVDPSFVDVVFYRVNPTNNKNEVGFVYCAD